jgi:hypothetical protein
MVFKKEVTVDYDKRDRHGRIVGKVLLEGKRYLHSPDRRWPGVALQAV